MSKKLFLLVLVLGLAANTALAVDPNLVGHWKMDTGSGTTATDSAGSNHGVMEANSVWYNDSERGWCMEFDGIVLNAGHVSVPPAAFSTVTTQMTVTFWAYTDPEQITEWPNTFRAEGPDDTWTGFYLAADGEDDIVFDAPQTNRIYEADIDVNDVCDVWSHWALTKNANTGEMKIYLNGEELFSASSMTTLVNGPTVNQFHIGSEVSTGTWDNGCEPGDGTDGFRGKLSDFRLYNRELTLQQVKEIALGPYAYGPDPGNGAVEVDSGDTLSWSPGIYVQDVNGHVLYFGTNETDVTDANVSNKLGVWIDPCEVVADGNRFSYTLGAVTIDTTYYWRVDEVNTTDGNSPWVGNVWSFTTVDYSVVDDFEDYNGTPGSGTNVFNTWTDGYDLDSSGSSINVSTVLEPNGPTNNSSFQSMYYQYASNGTHPDTTYTVPYFSEIYVSASDLDAGTDWTGGGFNKVAVLYFYGKADNDANETMYLGLEDGDGNYAEMRYGGGPGEDADDLRETSWNRWDIELNDYTVAGVNVANVDKVYLGFDDSVKASRGGTIGGTGTVFIDDIRLYGQICIPEKFLGNLNDDCIIDYDDVKILADKWLTDGTAQAATIWEETMDDDPNGDGWKTRSGTHHDYTIAGSKMIWPTGSTAIYGLIDTDPDRTFSGDTIIDVNWRATGANGDQGIGVWVNTGNDGTSGSFNSVYIRARLVAGNQQVAIRPGGGTGGATEITIATGLGTGMLTGHFEIDDVNNSMTYSIHDGNTPITGPLTLYPQSGGGSDQWFSIYSRYDCGGEFDYIKIVSDNPAFAVDEDLTGDLKINFDDFAVQADKWYQTQLFPISP